MKEKALETRLFREVKKMKGIALKLASSYHDGQTDRLLIMPGGITWFVELKTTGKKLKPLQEVFRDELLKRGQRYAFVDSEKSLNSLIAAIESARMFSELSKQLLSGSKVGLGK